MGAPRLALGTGDVHVWLVEPYRVREPAELQRLEAMLGEDERSRGGRFHFAEQRRDFVIAHALVRLVLSAYAPIQPADWRFGRTSHGRPEVDNAGQQNLHFSLSHTTGLMAVAVATDAAIGVDVEDIFRPVPVSAVADFFFAGSEAASLRRLPPLEQPDRFFCLWTLKEAYLKGRGLGLSAPLDAPAFSFFRGELTGVSFTPHRGQPSVAWQFTVLQPTPRHRLALAVQGQVLVQVRDGWPIPPDREGLLDRCRLWPSGHRRWRTGGTRGAE